MKSSFLILLLVLASSAPAARAESPAAPVAHPLGRNFTYVRVHALPGDLPAATTLHQGSLVLDLRFVPAGDDDAHAFAAWLRFQARPAAPVIVLINARTAPALLVPLTDSRSPAGVITLGPATASFKPDIALNVTAEADQRAYDAFEQGTPLEDLVAPKLDKTRHDEAEIARERAAGMNGELADSETTDDNPPAKTPPQTSPPVPPPAPVDAVLQRALQLHRALLALKKIP